jgi:hypothetical protein
MAAADVHLKAGWVDQIDMDALALGKYSHLPFFNPFAPIVFDRCRSVTRPGFGWPHLVSFVYRRQFGSHEDTKLFSESGIGFCRFGPPKKVFA